MKLARSLIAGALALGLAHTATAAGWPDRPIRIVVPFTAGGIVDSVARIVAQPLSQRLGQPVIVENKVGAGGAIGTESVAKAAPDGYTLLAVSPAHAVQPLVSKAARWDPMRDFRGIAGVGVVPNAVVVAPGSSARTLLDLLEQARAKPGSVTYGTAGMGTSNHLSGELLAQMSGVTLTQVPYKGQPEAMNDLLAGRISMMPLTSALATAHIREGKLRALAITTGAPSSLLPGIPTVAEAAKLPGYDVGAWFGFVAPVALSDALEARLSDEFLAILNTPEVRARLQGLGMEIAPQAGKDFDAYVAADYSKWADVLAKAGITAQ
ncbi:Bug family tripartite tricarboxylate transporter substrate binding protein [Achromobacter marplatensis]|uniref:Bug family tripartite tricarboxylate transporter substrate binding protein n=1 Tax=Achromobacter marplatensis TaxID=470868 RepID=UPI0039F6B890